MATRKNISALQSSIGKGKIPEPMTSASWARYIAEALSSRGLDGMQLCREAGIQPEIFEVPEASVRAHEIVRLWELAVSRSGDEAIGFLAAKDFMPAALDTWGYLMMASATLGDAMQRCVRYHGAHSTATTTSLTELDQAIRLEFHIMTGIIDVQRQNHDFMIFSTLKFANFITGKPLKPLLIEFIHAAPPYPAPYSDVAPCQIVFSAQRTAITFRAQDMAYPLVTANPQLIETLEKSADLRIAQHGISQILLRVRQLIVQALPHGEPKREVIAEKMHMSSRNLQRRLLLEGVTFQDILEDIRHSLAKRYLSDERISLSNIAGLLGFSDQSSFTRAAHRWFDETPSKLRARLRNHHDSAAGI